jgi:5-methylcytosine-specific restriction protein B
MFSPKVLDRAFTIELNEVDLAGYSGLPGPPRGTALRLIDFPGRLDPVARPGKPDWDSFGSLHAGELRRVVMELHGLLAGEQRHFGYRVANEIARFVMVAAEQAGDQAEVLWAALDLAILEKVLPKFHGTQQELDAPLRALFDFAVAGRRGAPAPAARDADGWDVHGGLLTWSGPTLDDGALEPALARTAAKVWRMLRRLQQQGFSSFIE